MRRLRILIAESTGFPLEAYNLLRHDADVVLADLDRPQLEAQVREADVLLVRLRHKVDQELLRLAPRLAVVACPVTGVNHIDTGALERRGIQLLCLRGEVEFLRDVRGTAEHTIGLMLALLRRVAASLLRRDGSAGSVSGKLLRAAWDDDCRLHLLHLLSDDSA